MYIFLKQTRELKDHFENLKAKMYVFPNLEIEKKKKNFPIYSIN